MVLTGVSFFFYVQSGSGEGRAVWHHRAQRGGHYGKALFIIHQRTGSDLTCVTEPMGGDGRLVCNLREYGEG